MDAKTKPAAIAAEVEGARMFKAPLSSLITAAEAGFGDVRRNPSSHIGDLVASIRAMGLLFPLAVKPHPTDKRKHVVVAGNRRLRALREIYNPGSEILIPLVDSDTAGAIELGLVDSVLSLPHHPVSRFEAFAALAKEGMSPTDIAARFGVPERVVAQSLAIEALAPEVREAWREGKITAEAAQAFTLEPNRKRQAQILKEQTKAGALHEYNIRRVIVGDRANVAHLVAFVGLDAYRAAGGKVQEDLFTARHAIDDPALAKRLADERLDEVCRILVVDKGWKWAARAETLPQNWSYTWERVGGRGDRAAAHMTEDEKAEVKRLGALLENDEVDSAADTGEEFDPSLEIEKIEQAVLARAFTDKQRAKSGVVVTVRGDGTLDAVYGVIQPADQPADAEGGAKPGKPAKGASKAKGAADVPAGPSNALMERLSQTLTHAARDAIADKQTDRRLGLAAMVAALESGAGFHNQPVKVNMAMSAMGVFDGDSKEKFPALLARLARKPIDDLVKAAAIIVGRALNLNRGGGEPPMGDEGVAMLCRLINPKALRHALLTRFDAEDYFGAVTKDACLAALKEMGESGGVDGALAKAAKAELAKAAAKAAKKHKWLPPELAAACASVSIADKKKGRGR